VAKRSTLTTSAGDPVADNQNTITEAMRGVPVGIVERQITHFQKADPEHGVDVANRMGLTVVDLSRASAAAE
jgi:catalase